MIGKGALGALVLLSWSALADDQCRVVKLTSLPIEFAGLRPTLQGTFNGVALHLLMDSGSYTTLLFPAGVHKAGLEPLHSDALGIGVGGTTHNDLVLAKEVEIGPSRGNNMRFLEATSTTDTTADGLLGADYLFRTDLEVVLKDKQVTFLQAEGCGDRPISYWDPDAPWIDSRDHGEQDRRQEVEVKINGRTFTALLDSGATRSVLDVNAAQKIGLTPDTAGTVSAGESGGVGSRKMAVRRAPLDSFEIGPEAIRHTTIQIADLYGAARNDHGQQMVVKGPDLILGADFMRAHHLLFAPSQHRLYFTYLGGQVFSLEPPAH